MKVAALVLALLGAAEGLVAPSMGLRRPSFGSVVRAPAALARRLSGPRPGSPALGSTAGDGTPSVVPSDEPAVAALELPEEKSGGLANTLKVGSYFALWYALNIGYNIYNKKVLNACPLPWTVATVQLAAGVLIFVPLWLLRLRKAPKMTGENMKNLLPIAALHTGTHVTAVLSLGAGAVSFTHIVKAAEPAFSAAFSAMFLGQIFATPVYAALLPVIGGVAVASMKELSFNWVSFGNAMGSNTFSALRGIYAKKSMGKPQGENMTSANLYAVLTLFGILMLAPLAAIVEGAKVKGAMAAASVAYGSKELFMKHMLYSGLFYYLYNEVAFLALSQVHPVTHAVGNTIKRVVVIVASVLVFGTQMTPTAIAGSTVAVLGTLAYALAKNHFPDKKK